MNKAKEKIAYLKLWLTFLVAIVVGSTAWVFNQDEETILFKKILTLILIITVGIIIGFVHRKTYKTIKTIED